MIVEGAPILGTLIDAEPDGQPGDLALGDDPTIPSQPDLHASNDSGQSDSDNITRETTVTFSGTGGRGERIELYDEDTSLGTTTVDASTATWTAALGPLADGEHGITARASNEYGNVSDSSPVLNLVVDTQGPKIDRIFDPDPTPPTGRTTLVYTIFNETIIADEIPDTLSLSFNDDNVPLGNSVTISMISDTIYQIDGLRELTNELGEYTLRVDATGLHDVAGNPGEGLAELTWVNESSIDDQYNELYEQIDYLAAYVLVNRGPGISLQKKLPNVLRKLNNGNSKAASKQVGAVLNHLHGLVHVGLLTAEQAQPALDAAETLRNSIEAVADAETAKWLVDRYYLQLVNLAKRKLGAMPPQVADDEGAVISAFRSFFSGVRVGQFPKLDDRNDLWKVLATLTTRKAVAQIRHHWRKRGEAGNGRDDAAVDEIASCQPTPDEAAAFREECENRIDALTDDRLSEIVLLRLQGWDTDQIADKLHVHRRSVQRKLALVEREWRDQIET